MNHTCRECGASFSSFDLLQKHKNEVHAKKKSNKTLIMVSIVIVVLALAVIIFMATRGSSGQYDEFAKCISDSGAKFYGAFWCSHCKNQKEAFGSSAKYLPYIECSTSDGQGQLQVCVDDGIEGYPTWEFSDGSRLGGEISMQVLAAKTGCQLPQ